MIQWIRWLTIHRSAMNTTPVALIPCMKWQRYPPLKYCTIPFSAPLSVSFTSVCPHGIHMKQMEHCYNERTYRSTLKYASKTDSSTSKSVCQALLCLTLYFKKSSPALMDYQTQNRKPWKKASSKSHLKIMVPKKTVHSRFWHCKKVDTWGTTLSPSLRRTRVVAL